MTHNLTWCDVADLDVGDKLASLQPYLRSGYGSNLDAIARRHNVRATITARDIDNLGTVTIAYAVNDGGPTHHRAWIRGTYVAIETRVSDDETELDTEDSTRKTGISAQTDLEVTE